MSVVWRQRFIVVVSTLLTTAAAVAAAFLMTPIYRATVTVIPAEADANQGTVSRLLGQFGGLAAIAGFGMNDRRAEAVAILRSQALVEAFIQENELLPILFEDEWDSERSMWTDEGDQPTVQHGYELFDRDIRRVREDPTAGTVTLEVRWWDRVVAAAWANEIVSRVNETMRRSTIEEASKTIEYLNKELDKTNVIELRQVLYNVIQEQISTIALANSREQFGLRVVDPAVPPPEGSFVRPRRTLMVLGGVIAGLLLGGLGALLREKMI